jgi:hypothetical protein
MYNRTECSLYVIKINMCLYLFLYIDNLVQPFLKVDIDNLVQHFSPMVPSGRLI